MTVTESTNLAEFIVNKCSHCGTFCVVRLSDLRDVITAGKRPQVKCYQCQKSFTAGPDINALQITGARTTSFFQTGQLTPPRTPKTLSSNTAERPGKSSVNRWPLHLLAVISASAALVYWFFNNGQIDISDIINILE